MRKTYTSILLAAVLLTATACTKDDSKHELPVGNTVETDFGKVTLCDYSVLSADEIIYEISDEDVEEEINNLLYDYIHYIDKESAENGDYVEVNMTGTADGNLVVDFSGEDNTYDVLLGGNEFGEAFDEKLLGAKEGDSLSFSIDYGADYEDDELAGLTVLYEVDVVAVMQEEFPELTEEFITDTLGYESGEAMRAEIREQLFSYYNSDTSYYAKEDLLNQIVENSTFSSYSDELYQSVKAEVDASYEEYTAWLGVDTVEEVYAAFDMSGEDIEGEVLNQVYRTIAVYAIAKEKALELTDAELRAGVDGYAQLYTEYYGEEFTAEQILSEFGEESLRYWILEDKVLDYLYRNATIHQVVGSIESGDGMMETMEEQ